MPKSCVSWGCTNHNLKDRNLVFSISQIKKNNLSDGRNGYKPYEDYSPMDRNGNLNQNVCTFAESILLQVAVTRIQTSLIMFPPFSPTENAVQNVMRKNLSDTQMLKNDVRLQSHKKTFSWQKLNKNICHQCQKEDVLK